MAEENTGTMPDMVEAGTPIPPIDNIHNIVNAEPDLPLPISNGALLQPPQTVDQLDTDIPDATPSLAPQNPTMPSNTTAQRTATPTRNVNGNVEVTTPMPTKAASHGAPARRYLNEKVTGVLLEGMKRLAAEQPEDPLRVLGEFLLQRSREMEGST
ncbi:COMPASS (complex proteins associated with Set1p) component [Mycoblastus sanguinarius]|nr:COMPASS (complex proteins associated with Set1p) component [Mycoblastus sanguinarius]